MNIKINGSFVDLETTFKPKLNMKFDTFEYGKINEGTEVSNFIKSLVLPLTNKNRMIFLPNGITDIFDGFYKIEINFDNGSLLTADCVVNHYSIEEKTIELDVFSGGFSFFRLIDSLSLNDLNLGSYQLLDGMGGKYTAYSKELQNQNFNLSAQLYGYNSWVQIMPDTNKPQVKGLNGLTCTFKDLKPALYLTDVLSAICAKVGYNLVKNEFINSRFFKSLLLPYGNGDLKTDSGLAINGETLNSVWNFSNGSTDFDFKPENRTIGQYGKIEFWRVAFQAQSTQFISHSIVTQPHILYPNIQETYSEFTFLESGTYEVECNFTLSIIPNFETEQSNTEVKSGFGVGTNSLNEVISIIQLDRTIAGQGDSYDYYKRKDSSQIQYLPIAKQNEKVDYNNPNDPVLWHILDNRISNTTYTQFNQESQPIKKTIKVIAGQILTVKTSVSVLSLASPITPDSTKYVNSGGFIKINKTDIAEYGSTINLASTLINTKAKDLIKGLAQIFCLVSKVDSVRKTVEFKPRFNGEVSYLNIDGSIGKEPISGYYKSHHNSNSLIKNRFNLFDFEITTIDNRPEGKCTFSLKPDNIVKESFIEVDFGLGDLKKTNFVNTVFEELHIGYSSKNDTYNPQVMGVFLENIQSNGNLPKPTFKTKGFKIASVTGWYIDVFTDVASPEFNNTKYRYIDLLDVKDENLVNGLSIKSGNVLGSDLYHQYAVIDVNNMNNLGSETATYKNMNYNFSIVDTPILVFDTINKTPKLTYTENKISGFFETLHNTFFASLKNNQQVKCRIKIHYFVLKNLDTSLIYSTTINHKEVNFIFKSITNYDIETSYGDAELIIVVPNKKYLNGTKYVEFKHVCNVENNLFITKK